MKELIDEFTVIINSRRQPPNFKKLLTKYILNSHLEKKKKKFGDPRYGTCNEIDEGEAIIFKSGDIFKVNVKTNW